MTKERAIEERGQVIQACFKKGLLILGCGENVIRLIPPLIITRREADLALAILDDVFKKIKPTFD
jgi:4-aminobutyrate aminotransferase